MNRKPKNARSRKLALRREKIVELTRLQLDEVHGGDVTTICSCPICGSSFQPAD